MNKYVLDTGALIAAERRKPRAVRFFDLADVGVARLFVPYPVLAEWWRGRTDVRDEILASIQVIATIDVAKAAGAALAHVTGVDAKLTIDAIVMAAAALADAVVVTQDPHDFDRLGAYFPGVTVISA